MLSMIPRYQHPEVARLWSDGEQYKQWLLIGRTVVHVQGEHGIIDPAVAQSIIDCGVGPSDLGEPEVLLIQKLEQTTGHDVAAFLQWWRAQLGENARFTHLGLTSSDLVDTALGMRFAELEPEYWRTIDRLQNRLTDLIRIYAQTPVLAYTHGQPAEPTTLGIRAQGWHGMLNRASARLSVAWGAMRIGKLSGPVGTYAHNPTGVELAVSLLLGLQPHGPGASQVVPRDRMAHWASCAAQLVQVLAKVGTDFRLMAHRGEVVEGWPEGRVGSSAMPHKKNPVTAEKLSGLARLAAGYAAMLQPVDLWDERDISHSSVERVAVPDLLHVLFHAMEAASGLMNSAWNEQVMQANLDRAGVLPYTAWYARQSMAQGFSPEEARRHANIWAEHFNPLADPPFTEPPTPLDMVRNHPMMSGLTPRQHP